LIAIFFEHSNRPGSNQLILTTRSGYWAVLLWVVTLTTDCGEVRFRGEDRHQGGKYAMIRRVWLVFSILWTVFWVGLYVIAGPLSAEEHLTIRANLTIMLAIPLVCGWLLYWIVTGSWRQ
jgi:hypothetical protein